MSRRPPAGGRSPGGLRSPADDRRLARDVAKQLERRRLRRRLVFWLLLLGAVIAAALYLTCGRGFGLGGPGKGEGEGPGTGSAVVVTATDAGPRRCAIRVAAEGISVDGKPASRDDAVATCKTTTGAEVIVTGDARQGDWDDLRSALSSAGVAVFRREPSGAVMPEPPPLAPPGSGTGSPEAPGAAPADAAPAGAGEPAPAGAAVDAAVP